MVCTIMENYINEENKSYLTVGFMKVSVTLVVMLLLTLIYAYVGD